MYNLRLYQDSLASNAVSEDLYAQHSIVYVLKGSATVCGKKLNSDEASYFQDSIPLTAGPEGAVIWRWELVRAEDDKNLARGAGIVSHLRMTRKIKMFEMYPTTRWQFKLDCIFDNEGSTGLHSHPGSGIRCLLSGNLSTVSEKGENTRNFNQGDYWYEEGAYPLISTTEPGVKSAFLRGMILPPEFAQYPDTAFWIEGEKSVKSSWKGYSSQIIHLR